MTLGLMARAKATMYWCGRARVDKKNPRTDSCNNSMRRAAQHQPRSHPAKLTLRLHVDFTALGQLYGKTRGFQLKTERGRKHYRHILSKTKNFKWSKSYWDRQLQKWHTRHKLTHQETTWAMSNNDNFLLFDPCFTAIIYSQLVYLATHLTKLSCHSSYFTYWYEGQQLTKNKKCVTL